MLLIDVPYLRALSIDLICINKIGKPVYLIMHKTNLG